MHSTITDTSMLWWMENHLPQPRLLSGVPQGSVLGPLLFLIYIDCIASVPLTGDSKLVLYADDVLLYIELQTDINAIHQCVRECHLTLNPSKCKVLIARGLHSIQLYTTIIGWQAHGTSQQLPLPGSYGYQQTILV